MLMPSIYGENLFGDFFDAFDAFPFFDNRELRKAEEKLYGRKASHMMSTDVKEKDGAYELEMDLPGFQKDEIQISLENGYLTIQAAKGFDQSEEDTETGKYIRKERYAGACSRSFYIGEEVTQEDVKAEFKHGILKLTLPKKEQKPAVEQNKYIAIEG
ncbi:MAG: Hsp20/alpha crystallin family protein [Roseburia sp.]|nr:Hsp20/alpha crystallin family protein [Roseburia sp.]